MKREATPDAVVDLLALLDAEAIDVWLDGGWGVDALLGMHTRAHKDVDIIVQVSDRSRLVALLVSKGYFVHGGGRPSNFVMSDARGIEVDIHAVRFDPAGNGIYRMATGEDWTYPAEGFSGRGTVNGATVRCLSARTQVLCHAYGYMPTEKDFQDMERLEERFSVELPLRLRRRGRPSNC
jgi:lincosamide nucleotidyltransferase A/C/D/E